MLICIPTTRALSRCIPRINSDYRNSRDLRFVLDECSQLPKGPIPDFSSAHLLNPNPLANPGKLLQDDRPLRAFAFFDKLFRNLVVEVGRIARFFLLSGAQPSFRALRLFLLQSASQAAMALSQIARMGAGERLAVTVGGDARNPQIDSQIVIRIVESLFAHIDGGIQIPLAVAVNQIGFALLLGQQFLFTRAADERNLCSAVDRPD